MMNDIKKVCDLCGLTVEISGFNLKVKEGDYKEFCCEGCKGIYSMLHEDEVVTEIEQQPESKLK